jgi:hypothetical protein
LKYVISAELLNKASRNALQIGQPNARKPTTVPAVAVFPSLRWLFVRWREYTPKKAAVVVRKR